MIIHVLPGDAQIETFNETGIEGELAVCRECLVEGPVGMVKLEDFWKMRAEFLSEGNPEAYFEKTVPEFEKLINAPAGSEINLWFEYELFCQTNMWFCLYLLKDTAADIYRVAPIVRAESDKWDGFGGLNGDDLKRCFAGRTKFSREDIRLGAELWDAFQSEDHERLVDLSKTSSPCFPYLEEVGTAAAEKDTRPREILSDILSTGETGIEKIFPIFRERAGVYGYGDSQVERILAGI
jgi:hypothetical protein